MLDNDTFEYLMEDCQFVDIMCGDILNESDSDILLMGAIAGVGLSVGILGIQKSSFNKSVKNRKMIPIIYDVADKIYRYLNTNKIDIVDRWDIIPEDSWKNEPISFEELRAQKSTKFKFVCEFKHYNFDYRTDHPYYQKIVKYCKSIGFCVITERENDSTILKYSKDDNFYIIVQYDGGLSVEFRYTK